MIELCKRACKGCTSDGTLCRQFASLLDKWVPVLERLPKKNGEFLVSMEVEIAGEIYGYIDISHFAKDLCKVDYPEFCDKEGIAGFYKHSDERGPSSRLSYEVFPIAWQPLPGPYKEKIK